MAKKANIAKQVRADLEAKMDNKRGESKSPDNSDKDEVVGMNGVQRKTPSPHKLSTAKKAVALPKKTPSCKRTPPPDDDGDDSDKDNGIDKRHNNRMLLSLA